MDTLTAIARMETPTLVINHCSDVGCSHPSCWESRKLYRRNAYILMLKGVPPKEIRPQGQFFEKPPTTRRDAEIPTQKVHNIVNELFNSIDGSAVESDDWHSTAGRGISAGQLSIKHLPTPMSSLSRQREPKLRGERRFRRADGTNKDAEKDSDDDYDEEELDDEEIDDKDLSRRVQGRWRHPVVKQQSVRVQDMSAQQQNDVGRQFAALYQHSREYVWVPNPNRKPKDGPLRRSDPEPTLACVNINKELGQFLHEDNYNQRQAALQERAVERSHLSTAKVQRFFKSLAPSSTAKHSVDLFKLPSDLLTEVLRSVDLGEPMTNESLARMVEQAAETPTGLQASGQQAQPPAQAQSTGSEFERHVMRQRRAQLHNSDSGRNLREPQKHTARTPVFLMDSSPVAAEQRRLPPIESAPKSGQRQQRKAQARTGGASKLVVGQFKRSLGRDCQLMLGPVSPTSTPSSSASISQRSSPASAAESSTSMAVQCSSGRSTLLDEVLPSRLPGSKDSTLAALLAMNRPTYELDDPWSTDNANYPAEALHPTTRQGTRLSSLSAIAGADEMDSAADSGGVCHSLTTPAPLDPDDEKSDIDEAFEKRQQEQQLDENSLLNTPTTTMATGGDPGAPPPSPDIGRVPTPPPSSPIYQQQQQQQQQQQRQRPLTKAKSAASSGQLMPTLDEDEEGVNNE